jgi:O-glycosyl hydrolase
MLSKISIAFLAVVVTAFTVQSQSIKFTIDLNRKAQTIDNIGASGAWYSENIGKYWRSDQKERMAELLFSKGFDENGQPSGIGLSAWRFNIGGGTAEQGARSGIKDPLRRVECFLSADSTYNWNKQSGYLWFVKQAKSYGVENLIAFSNTPPVQFTKNGLGFKTTKDYITNLKDDKYAAFADFLATVVQHFDEEGLHFNYLSPVNEPQWDWSNKFGQMHQEGTPWHNKDIYRITVSLDSALSSRKLSTKILLPEASKLTDLYEGEGHAHQQIPTFYSPRSTLYVGHLKQVHPVIAGHSYFTDLGDTNIINVRSRVRDAALNYNIPFWQSEYCMLGDGYKEGKNGKVNAMDCALFLSKMIYHDLAVANASAWHLWNAWEPGNADFDTRYYLLSLKKGKDNTAGDFCITKNLWALGHYSRFIRPGMQRVITERSDHKNDIQAAQDVMLSAFTNGKQVVVVAMNYTKTNKEVSLELPAVQQIKAVHQYVTTAHAAENMKPYPVDTIKKIMLKPRSIVTLVIDQ